MINTKFQKFFQPFYYQRKFFSRKLTDSEQDKVGNRNVFQEIDIIVKENQVFIAKKAEEKLRNNYSFQLKI